MCDDKDKKLYIQSCKLNLKNNFFIPGGSVFQTPLFAAILVQRFATPLRVAFQIAISVAVATRHSAPRAVLVLDVVIPVWDPRSVFPVSLILKKLNHWFLLWLVFFMGIEYFWGHFTFGRDHYLCYFKGFAISTNMRAVSKIVIFEVVSSKCLGP